MELPNHAMTAVFKLIFTHNFTMSLEQFNNTLTGKNMTTLPTLYSRTSTGAVQQWTIEIDGSRTRTHHGQHGGKIVTTEWFDSIPTNVGRANERNGDAQAMFEAAACWKKKVDSGCFQDISKIDTFTYIEPMLAKKWEDRKSKVVFPVFCQPKLDGMRAIITRHGAKSRNGKPWVTIPHILRALEPLFAVHPDLILDGELYCHGLHDDFNKISSLIKKTKPTAADLQESAATIQYHWYDIADNSLKFLDRNLKIERLCNEYGFDKETSVVPVRTYVAIDEQTLDTLYGTLLEDGYEGQMVRTNDLYEFKRSNTLLKRKEFQDDEYLIVEICEGNGNKSGMAGYVTLERPDGKRFSSNIKGNHTFLKQLLADAPSYVGKYATCKYFNLTPDGIPRFPYVIGFRDGQGID
jgi:DNA ligase-1